MSALHNISRETSNDASGENSLTLPRETSSGWSWRAPASSGAKPDRHTTPFGRTVLSGSEVLREGKYNKGYATSIQERQALCIHGLMPACVMSMELQVKMAVDTVRAKTSDLERYIYLMGLQDRNETLFYRVLVTHIEEMMPLVYTPTVGQSCLNYHHVLRRPRGLFLSSRDQGRMNDIMKNWPEPNVRVIVVTDGERILGLGDLGSCGMGIPIGKLSLYVACGGVRPHHCLPIQLDVGTENTKLLADPAYIGLRQRRIRGQQYQDLLDEFVTSARHRFGANVLIQFEDFGNANAFPLLERYRHEACTFNDDIQGTASVALAGILSASRKRNVPLADNTFLFVGAGSASLGIAELIVLHAMTRNGVSEKEIRSRIFLVDSKGLVVKGRSTGGINAQKGRFAHEGSETKDIAEMVRTLKPTVLIGASAQPGVFTQEVCEAMLHCDEPTIFALSNPTSKAECSAEHAYTHTKGRCIFASGSPFAPVTIDGQQHVPGQGNNAFIFPGVGLGIILAEASRVPEECFLIAAERLSELTNPDDLTVGCVYPRLHRIRECSEEIAIAIVDYAYAQGIAAYVPRPPNTRDFVHDHFYHPTYSSYVDNTPTGWEDYVPLDVPADDAE